VEIPALSSALQGMSRAQTQFDKAAANIARATTVSPTGGDIVDLSAPMVSMLESRNSFDANTKVFKVADEMQKSLLNIVG
jgi:flagellar hook protein FlgE